MESMTGARGSSSKKWARTEFIALIAVVLLTWSYVIVRATLVPFVQDEANSFWLYAHSGEFLPFRSHTDAGNHFLSSLFGVIGYKLFGYSALGIRWGSVLSFPFYAWGCWTLVKRFEPLLRWCSFLALALCPFILDFFAMFRGYGPAMAGLAWALAGLIAFMQEGRPRHLMLMVVSASLALFADLSILPVCGILFGLAILLPILERRRQMLLGRVGVFISLAMFGVVITYASLIALDLREKDLLYLGSREGLMNAPVRSLIDAVFFGPRSLFIDQIIIAPVFVALVIAIWQLIRKRQWRSPLIVLFSVLFLEVLGRVMMFHLLGTNYPYDRAALQWVPLYILVIASAIDLLGRQRTAWYCASLLLLVFPVRTLITLNTDRLVGSYEKAMPLRYIEEVADLKAKLERPIMLSGFEQFASCWAFHQTSLGFSPIEMRSDIGVDDPDDVRVISQEDLEEYGHGYHVADSSASGVLLLFRDVPCTFALVSDTILPSKESDAEWIYLPLACPTHTAGICIVFNAVITTEDPVSNIMLVTEVLDSTKTYARYDAVELRHWPGLTYGTSIEVARYMPEIPLGGSCSYYLWNQRHTHYRLSNVRIRTFRIQEP